MTPFRVTLQMHSLRLGLSHHVLVESVMTDDYLAPGPSPFTLRADKLPPFL